MICPKCGHHNSDESRFCSHCGTQLVGGGRAESGPRAGTGGEPAPRRSDQKRFDTTSIISDAPSDSVAGEVAGALGGLDSGAQDKEGGSWAGALEGAVDALPPGSAILVVARGPNAGSRYLLDKDRTTAGRHTDSDIFLDDVTVSRRHAEFRSAGGEFTVSDVGSLNGTYVNRERIDTAVLANHDEVQIGKFRLRFLAGRKENDAADGAGPGAHG